MDKLNKIESPITENTKRDIEFSNNKEKMKDLISKFNERLSKNPIAIYVQHDKKYKAENPRTYNAITNTYTDISGTGGSVGFDFDDREYISVTKNEIRPSSFFDSRAEYYKITEDSFQNILRMMDELIRASGYSDVDKSKMFQYVIDNFKEKIIKEEDIVKQD